MNLNQEPLAECLTVKEVQFHLGISHANVYNLVNQEGFPKLRIGRRIVVPRRKFLEWIKQNTTKT